MPGKVAQMFEQALDVVKGYDLISRLDKTAKLSATVLESEVTVPAGRVAHLNSAGEFELGGSGTQMPIFLWQGSHSPDVRNDGESPVSGLVRWTGIDSGGVMSGLVATGGYELQTTEFDDTRTYSINDPLTADSDGILTNQGVTVYTTWICGICSSFVGGDDQSVGLGVVDPPVGPVGYNAHRVKVITFWTYFLPGTST